MLLRQQELEEHEEGHVFQGKEEQNPTLGTQPRTQSELEECLPHYHGSRNSQTKKEKKAVVHIQNQLAL